MKISELGATAYPSEAVERATAAEKQSARFSDCFADAISSTVNRIKSDAALSDRTEAAVGVADDPVFETAADPAVSGETAAAEARTPASDGGQDMIQDALNKAIEENLVNTMLGSTASSGLSDYSALSGGGGIESLLLASAAGGEITDNQLAMFMLCMMMNSATEGSDTSMLMSAMSALLPQTTGSSATAQTTTAKTVQGWESRTASTSGSGDAGAQSDWDGAVKSAAPPSVSNSGAVLPYNPGAPVTPAVVSTEGRRSASSLRAVIDQFDVENTARYANRNGNTYCNIFLWDVTSALGCEIPHHVDAATLEPRTYPDLEGSKELNANGVCDWMAQKGREYGWREVTEAEAQAYANQGLPVVGTWKNPGGAGHVQIVSPSEDGAYDPVRGPAIAQAGSTLSNYTYQSSIYSAQTRQNVKYYVHA